MSKIALLPSPRNVTPVSLKITSSFQEQTNFKLKVNTHFWDLITKIQQGQAVTSWLRICKVVVTSLPVLLDPLL